MDVQARWEDKRDVDCAEHGQPKCRSFPDCSCQECHEHHVEEGEFNEFCQTCADEKCVECDGKGHVMKIDYFTNKHEEFECEECGGSGRS